MYGGYLLKGQQALGGMGEGNTERISVIPILLGWPGGGEDRQVFTVGTEM